MSVNTLININELNFINLNTTWNYFFEWIVESITWVTHTFFYLTWLNNFFLNENMLENTQNSVMLLANSPINLLNTLPSWLQNIFFQNIMYYNLSSLFLDLPVIHQILITKLISYNFVLVWNIVKYSLGIYICYYIIIFNFFNTNLLNNVQNSLLLKFLHAVDSEEELGSIDDLFTLIFLFIIVFGWFFSLTLFFSYTFNNQFILFGVGFLVLIIFILLTPLSTLLDFGISFTTYIRGASSSSNLLVECVFDIIGTLVVFTRFIVQNIRFVLIFFAYFELFEWTYNSSLIQTILNITNFNIKQTMSTFFLTLTLDSSNLFLFLSIVISSTISYLYYLVHLLILIFVQVTIYLLISFWLFFFFYTSFSLNKNEKLFILKK